MEACVCLTPYHESAIPANKHLVAGTIFYIAKVKFLARLQPDKVLRWDYDYVEVGAGSDDTYHYAMNDMSGDYSSEDEWTVGSSSGISSGCLSPVSPIDDVQSLWSSASETIAATSEVDPQDYFVPSNDERV